METAATPGDDEIRRIPTEARCGGEWVTIGLDAYRFAPVNFEVIKGAEFQADMATISGMSRAGMPNAEQMGAVERIILCSLRRNYPSKTAEDVSSMLDIASSLRIVAAALGVSGFVNGKASALGETVASTGTASIAP